MNDNRSYLIRSWIPALLIIGTIGFFAILALFSGDPIRVTSVVCGVAGAALIYFFQRAGISRRVARALRAEDPTPYLRWFKSTVKRVPQSEHLSAGHCATILALYGRFDDAEKALAAVSWNDLPPIIEAQGSAARAILAYARGEFSDGLDHAVAASLQSSVDPAFPGAAKSEMAFRTIRNLGLALAGRATDTTHAELRSAFETLPLVGRINAAWGLAAIAKRNGADDEYASMIAFLRENVPHFAPLLVATRRPDA